jgi:hypothetical protein
VAATLTSPLFLLLKYNWPLKDREKVEIAGWREPEVAERAAMDGDDVGEPERQVGQIVRKDFLNFAAEFAGKTAHYCGGA